MVENEDPSFISLLKSNTSLNVENAVEALLGSESLYEKLVKQVIRLIPSRVESMDGFLKEGCDLSAFGVSVHGVKGSLRQVGCKSLAMAAESLERAAKAGDRQYCIEHYVGFKEDLLRFHKEITNVLPGKHTAKTGCIHNITDYYDLLCRARDAAEDYDSISAAESISQLTNVRFTEEVDNLVSDASRELESFRSEQALDYIIELINICEKPIPN